MIFKRKKPILTVTVNGTEICRVASTELPTEKQPTIRVVGDKSEVVFEEPDGTRTVHSLGSQNGWFGFSIRVYENLACQADCIFGEDENLSAERFQRGDLSGIRFQPFFLGKARTTEAELKGHGLFQRGLHFSGTITPGNVSLSCICDECRKSFRLQSFHAGFSNCGYMYSESGMHTITIPGSIEGSPPALGKPDSALLKALEIKLPKAPDGTSFAYLNPLRCPNCSAPYINFTRFPEDRENEYYENTYFGEPTIQYEE